MTNASVSTPLSRSAWTHPTALPFAIMGTIAVVGGSLLSAALAPNPSYHGNWAVAYIVLVAGVGQIVLGVGQAAVTAGRVRPAVVAVQALMLNLGAVATVIATVDDIAALLYLAAVMQIVALVGFLWVTRHVARGLTLMALRIVAVLLLISVPTGVVLQALVH
ncbi:hypothetical protein [Microbacterium terrisoli]|jgi:hypothetical protein|uniref:hypothetical protein n=1 Tax=Microbacterium terrisoli TaxID=3242192 RepID=UPI0028063493|nr:hypothetical protein [Microbacterium protaetiae]